MTDNERPFNPHGNLTADGVLIVPGLRVLDNNYDVGTVTLDEHDGDHGRANEHWYRVELDYIPGAPDYSGNRHGGYRVMNGERLSTTLRNADGRRVTVEGRLKELTGPDSEPKARLMLVNGRLVVES